MSSCIDSGIKSSANVHRISSINVKRRRKKKSSCSAEAKLKTRHFASSVDKQFIFRNIAKEFGEWPSWQKHTLLCRWTEKTSLSLLSILSTVLEPVFHKDFEVTFQNANSFSKKALSVSDVKKDYTVLSKCCESIEPTGKEILLALPVVKNFMDNSEPSKTNSIQRNQKKSMCLPFLQTPEISNRNFSSQMLSCERKNSEFSSLSDLTLASDFDKLEVCEKRGASHSHAIKRNTDSVSTIEFLKYPQKANINRLGNLMRPSTNDECLREYKNRKWWLPPISDQHLKQASKGKLLRSFEKISDKFVQEYMLWTNAEKGDFLLYIVDYCSSEEIIFLATCIYDRLAVINSINNVSDNVLLNIFSYLDIDDLKTISEVSQRWQHLSSVECVWKNKCYNLAHEHCQSDILKHLEASSVVLNWRDIYDELKESILILEHRQSCMEDLSSPLDQVRSEGNIDIDEKVSLISSDGNSSIPVDVSVVQEDQKTSGGSSLANYQDGLCLEDNVSVIRDSKFTKLERGKSPNMEILEDEHTEELESIVNDGDQGLLVSTHASMLEKASLQEDSADSDVALDVRGRLIQADNQIKQNDYRIHIGGDGSDEDEFQLVPVDNLRSVKRVRKLEGHDDAVLCLQFDSKRVITGSADRTVRFWDIRSGSFFHCLKGHQGGVHCLKFDDKYIATGSWDTTVMIWDVIYFSLLHTLTEHSACVSCIEMNQDILITGSYDNSVCIFKRHTWQLLSKLTGHEAPVSCMTLISASELITGSHDKNLYLWSLKNFSILRKFKGSKSAFLSLKVCGALVAGGASDGSISFWNFSNGNIEGTIHAHAGNVHALCFVESRFFSAGGDCVVKEWDLATCTCLRSLRGHKGPVLCLRASSKRIVSGSTDGTIRVWDLACKLQQIGGAYDELNKGVIPTQILNEHQFKNMTSLHRTTFSK